VRNLTGERKPDVKKCKIKLKYCPFGDIDIKRRLYIQTSPRGLQWTVNISETGKVLFVSIDNSK
jgi:hypothetical protein